MRRPDQLKRVPDDFLDGAGNPLFEDLPDEVYLSPEYEQSDFELLDMLAVKKLSFGDISTRIRADLESPSSRWKASTTSDDWVTRSASKLMKSFRTPGATIEPLAVSALPLVPLLDGLWVSSGSASDSIFHPDSAGVPVPTDLGLRLVDPQALKNPARKALFTKLGLQNCVPKDVISLVLKKYSKWSNVPLDVSVSHLQYLYWHLPKEKRDLPNTVYLKDQNSQPIYYDFFNHDKKIVVEDLYFETDNIYEAKQLAMRVESGSKITCPGIPLHYINCAYMDAVPSDVRRCDTSWGDWLYYSAGVQRTPRLINFSAPTSLSDLFLYILKWRSDRLVGTLKAHWGSYKDQMTNPVTLALREAVVPCQNKENAPLQTTYLPLPELVNICKKIEIDKGFPFLQLPVEIDSDAEQDWKFLRLFNVGYKANVRFYLDVLRQFVQNHQSLNDVMRQILVRIYEAVEKHTRAEDREFVW